MVDFDVLKNEFLGSDRLASDLYRQALDVIGIFKQNKTRKLILKTNMKLNSLHNHSNFN